MSATAIVLGAYALAAAPALFHWATGRGGSIIASIYIGLGLVVLGNLILSSSPMPQVPAVPAAAATDGAAGTAIPADAPDGAASQCAQLVSALRNANVLLDTSRPPQVVVNGGLWRQIPEGQRGAVVTCIAQELPEGSGKPAIVER